MATITSNGTGGGLWSAGATWVGGVAPVDDDTVVIASGDTVTFNVDTSGFANGINGMTITGTLKVSTTTSSYMKMKAATQIVGAGTFNIGESGAGAIPFAVKFTLTGGDGWYIDGASGLTLTVYGVEPTNTYIQLSANEAISQTVLSVDTDVTGDIWAVGDTVFIGEYNNNDNETYTIADKSATEITLSSGLSAAKDKYSVIGLLTRNITIISESPATATLVGFGNNKITIGSGSFIGDNKAKHFASSLSYVTITGGVFYNYNYVSSGGSYWNVSNVAFFCNNRPSHLTNNSTFDNVIVCTFAVWYGLSGILSNSYICGNASSSFETVANLLIINSTIINRINCFTGSSVVYLYNCALIGGSNISTGNFVTAYYSTISAINIGAQLYYAKFYACDISSSSILAFPSNNIVYQEHIEVGGVSGAYKSYTAGGTTTSQATVLPSGYALGYVTPLVSATYYGYMKREIKIPAGEEVSIEVQLRKDASMAYLPRVFLMDIGKDPIIGATPVDSFTMTDSTNTWESDTFTIDNSAGTIDKDYTLWFVGKNASGNVYSAYDITTQGTSGGGSVKILPYSGKVGLV